MWFFKLLCVGFLGLSAGLEVQYHESDFPFEPLPKMNVDLNETSLTGLSSGAFFATQFHVAHSSFVKGAGMIAGGPYGCVNEHITILTCIGQLSLLNPIRDGNIYLKMKKLETAQKIDQLDNIKRQRLFVTSGLNDSFVKNPAQKGSVRLYQRVVDPANFVYEEYNAAHTFPTDFDASPGNTPFSPCQTFSSPYVSNCQYDTVGKVLTHIYGPMNPRNPPSNPLRRGRFLKFDQNELLTGIQTVNTQNLYNIGLGPAGFLYIPDDCKVDGGFTESNKCKLHIVLHGCSQQVSGDKGMYFIANTGFIQYADTNKIILAFPQTVVNTAAPNFSSLFPLLHPGATLGCWDFFGMYDSEYHTKNGRQIQAVRNLIDKIVP